MAFVRRNGTIASPEGDTSLQVTVVATIPPSPSMVSVVPGNQHNVITWNSVPGATNYIVVWDTDAGVQKSDNQIDTGSVNVMYSHTGLTNGTSYYYRVFAQGPWGDTAVSQNELSGVPISYNNQYSLLFDGIDEFVGFGNNHNFENNQTFSVSMWIRTSNLSVARQTLWAKATDDSGVDGWGLYLEPTTADIFLQMRAQSQKRAFTFTNTNITINNWFNVVLTFNGNQNINGCRAYVNGSVLATPSSGVVSNTLLSTAPSQVARRNSAFPFVGHIDEVTFWNIELSQAEVTELYNAGSPDDPNNHSQSAACIHWYKFGDLDSFNTASDSIGTVDGTMTNMEAGDIVAVVP